MKPSPEFPDYKQPKTPIEAAQALIELAAEGKLVAAELSEAISRAHDYKARAEDAFQAYKKDPFTQDERIALSETLLRVRETIAQINDWDSSTTD